METSIHCAVETLLGNNIHSLPISSYDVESMVKNEEFEIVPYSVPINTEYAAAFESLGLLEIAKQYKSFTYVSNDYKLVFYRSNLSAQERIRLLAHELGHIRLKHLTNRDGIRCSSGVNTPQEIEAEEFAIELIAPTCVLKKKYIPNVYEVCHLTGLSFADAERVFLRLSAPMSNTAQEKQLCRLFKQAEIKRKSPHGKRLIIILAVMMILLSSFCDIPKTNNRLSNDAIDNNEMVVITPTGKKYHSADCYHIKGSETRALTMEEASRIGYAPCKDCIK